MSIELPQYSIQTAEKAPSKFKKLLLPCLIIIGLIAGYFSSDLFMNQTIKSLRVRNVVLEDINNENQNVISQLSTELSLLKTEKKVKQQAIIILQNDYKEAIDEQTELKSEITFYEQLLNPNAKNKGLRVFESSIEKRSDNDYELKIILVQKLERAKEISGKIQINLIGSQNKLTKTLDLSKKMPTKYQFRYFHNFSLRFSLAEGFKPEQLVVKLFPQNKKAKTVEYTAKWQEIIQ